MTGEQVLQFLAALSPEERKLPFALSVYIYGDEMGGERCEIVEEITIKPCGYGRGLKPAIVVSL